MRETYWMRGKDNLGDGWHTSYTKFWKMLCYEDNDEPVTGEKIEIDYSEYSR